MEFDFLKQHGYGVVYGADAVRQKIIELGHLDPKERKMNERNMDVAFEPMDKQHDKAVVHPDGTISVPIVEGDTYIDGVRQPKPGEKIFVQDEEAVN